MKTSGNTKLSRVVVKYCLMVFKRELLLDSKLYRHAIMTLTILNTNSNIIILVLKLTPDIIYVLLIP